MVKRNTLKTSSINKVSNKAILIIFIIIFISIAGLAIYFIEFNDVFSDISLNNQNNGKSDIELSESSGLTGGITLEINPPPPPPRKVTLKIMPPPQENNTLEK